MKISVVIPAYNEEKYLPICLKAITEHGQKAHEVIVVDNASTDRTAQIAKSFPGVHVVIEKRKGVTRARQRGAEEATGDIVAFLDADTRMPAGWIEQVEATFTGDKNIVSLSGPYSYDDAGIIGSLLNWCFWTLLALPLYWIVGYMAVGGNLAVRRSALEQSKGFDTEIEFYGDDTDIAQRLAAIGRVKFSRKFLMHTSARRLSGEGYFRMGIRYGLNYLSVLLRKKPVTETYEDFR